MSSRVLFHMGYCLHFSRHDAGWLARPRLACGDQKNNKAINALNQSHGYEARPPFLREPCHWSCCPCPEGPVPRVLPDDGGVIEALSQGHTGGLMTLQASSSEPALFAGVELLPRFRSAFRKQGPGLSPLLHAAIAACIRQVAYSAISRTLQDRTLYRGRLRQWRP